MVGENRYHATWVAEKYHHWQIPDGPATAQDVSSLSEVYQGSTSMAFPSTSLGTAQDPYMVTDQPGNFSYHQLLDRPFNNPGRNDLINDTPYQGEYWNQVYYNWQVQGRHMTGFLQEGTGTVLVSLETILEKFEADLLREQQEVQARKEVRGHVTRWKTKQGILRVKRNEPAGEASPTSHGKEYEELLQDV